MFQMGGDRALLEFRANFDLHFQIFGQFPRLVWKLAVEIICLFKTYLL